MSLYTSLERSFINLVLDFLGLKRSMQCVSFHSLSVEALESNLISFEKYNDEKKLLIS